jgi:hypothetical protein
VSGISADGRRKEDGFGQNTRRNAENPYSRGCLTRGSFVAMKDGTSKFVPLEIESFQPTAYQYRKNSNFRVFEDWF